MFLIFFVLSFVVAGLHIYRDKQQPRTGRRIAEILLLWLLVINTGLGGIWAFIGHTVFAGQVAESIGWPAGNPFQTEVAVANLAVGTLGILSYWIRGNFWTAAVIATSIWLLGAAAIHLVEIVAAGNYNPGNAGLIFYLDILGPLLLIALLIYTGLYKLAGQARARPAGTEQPTGQHR
ncbi:MAG: hypothetical protein M3246_09690 [Actinomycetota bacterium]|nr:hypothetical protein [Actinomycetota bacterium]